MISTTSAQVLDLPELLENILTNLDFNQLFAVQRVNSTFRDTMANSKKLQRMMFKEQNTNATSELNLYLAKTMGKVSPGRATSHA